MKKDRNCGTPYPVYPTYPGMMPNMMPGVPMMPNMMSQTMPQNNMITDNTIEQQVNSLEQRLNILDRRVTALENKNSTTYNSTNYQML